MQYQLLITQCPDTSMWYAGKVNTLVPFCGAWQDTWKSREPSGSINIVHFADALLVRVENNKHVGAACPSYFPQE